MFSQLLSRIFLILVVCLTYHSLVAQQPAAPAGGYDSFYLQKKNKKVDIFPNDYIGLTTTSDTVKYFGEKFHSYKLFKIEEKRLLLRRPLIFKDTTVESNRLSVLDGREYVYGKVHRTGKKWFTSIVLVDAFEYRIVAIEDVTSIQYPPDAGNTMGCFSCAIIPVYNIFYFMKLRQRWHPENFPIGKWRMKLY